MGEHRLDITDVVCPMTWVKTKLKLETMSPGDVLVVRLKLGEALENVPRSASEEGHRVEQMPVGGEEAVEILITKNGLRAEQ